MVYAHRGGRGARARSRSPLRIPKRRLRPSRPHQIYNLSFHRVSMQQVVAHPPPVFLHPKFHHDCSQPFSGPFYPRRVSQKVLLLAACVPFQRMCGHRETKRESARASEKERKGTTRERKRAKLRESARARASERESARERGQRDLNPLPPHTHARERAHALTH